MKIDKELWIGLIALSTSSNPLYAGASICDYTGLMEMEKCGILWEKMNFNSPVNTNLQGMVL